VTRPRAARLAVRLALLATLGILAGELGARLLATPGYGAPISRAHPVLGWELLPGVRTRHVSEEFDVAICVDAAGLRQPADAPAEASAAADAPAGRALVVLGDSFSFGQGVEAEQRFSAQLPGWRVSNHGVPAYGTDQELLQYEARRPAADVVLLAYLVDNVVRNGAAVRDGRPKPRFTLADGALELHVPAAVAEAAGPAPGARGGLRTWLWEHSHLYRTLRRRVVPLVPTATDAVPYPQYAGDDPAWQVTRALLARLSREAPRLAVMIIPEAWQVEPGADDSCQRALLAACAELGIPALDLTPALRERRAEGPLYFPIDGHWTAAGHAAAAAALRPFLEALPPAGD